MSICIRRHRQVFFVLHFFIGALLPLCTHEALCGEPAGLPVGGSSSARPAGPPSILFAIADDWSWPHAGAYGDRVVHTPAFDRVASQGVLFANAFCASPSCTPSRGAILTGQAIHRLEEGGNLWSILPSRFAVYPDLLESAGYTVGCLGKGWGPGTLAGSGRSRNPAGPASKSFEAFLSSVPPDRPYAPGSGAESGLRAEDVRVPPFLPDLPEVRSDILDYYFEVQRFDHQVDAMLDLLEESGRSENTIVVITSDNGMPFPRAKANLYGAGTHMPLAIRWPARVKAGRRVDEFVSLTDIAPTLLEAAGIEPPPDMTGRSLVELLSGAAAGAREVVFLERERHANVRKGDLSYPARGVRTREFLYIRNLRPDRWPAGDPEMWKAVGPFGDVDGSPTKDLLIARREEPGLRRFFDLAFARRPAEELYDLARDPNELANVADRPEYTREKDRLRAELDRWMRETGDPRADDRDDRWDRFPYVGPPPKGQR